MNVVDLFCGAGGFSFGFELAGLKVKYGIDVWEPALRSFKENHDYSEVLMEDIFEFKGKRLNEIFSQIDVILGGPPCQAFSTVGKRALDDKRALLVKEYARIIKEVKPQVFVFENVKGFPSFAKGILLREILDLFDSLGYELTFGVLNAKDYGVPQNRERFIIIGALDKKIEFPEPLNFEWSFRDATSDLPEIHAGEKAERYLTEPQNDLQRYYRRKSPEVLTEHEAKNHSNKLLEMMKFIPEGKSAHEVFLNMPEELRPTSGYKNTYKRIKWDEPAPTITRNYCVPSSSNCIHPQYNRALTLREAARIQSFPDDFVFYGSDTDKRIQVGNAVPPLLGKAIAEQILKSFN
ncbi:DNA cytosine methyltransferase [Nautilia lithotrophica]